MTMQLILTRWIQIGRQRDTLVKLGSSDEAIQAYDKTLQVK
jgi:hypothetical protein